MCSQGTPVSSSTSSYLSGTWVPPDSSGCGHLMGSSVYTSFTVERDNGSAYSASVLQVQAFNENGNDSAHGYLDAVTAIVNLSVSDNPRAYWCYEASYVGYSLV